MEKSFVHKKGPSLIFIVCSVLKVILCTNGKRNTILWKTLPILSVSGSKTLLEEFCSCLLHSTGRFRKMICWWSAQSFWQSCSTAQVLLITPILFFPLDTSQMILFRYFWKVLSIENFLKSFHLDENRNSAKITLNPKENCFNYDQLYCSQIRKV